jgi:hypothetical protein
MQCCNAAILQISKCCIVKKLPVFHFLWLVTIGVVEHARDCESGDEVMLRFGVGKKSDMRQWAKMRNGKKPFALAFHSIT